MIAIDAGAAAAPTTAPATRNPISDQLSQATAEAIANTTDPPMPSR